jgi:hypothetical protein
VLDPPANHSTITLDNLLSSKRLGYLGSSLRIQGEYQHPSSSSIEPMNRINPLSTKLIAHQLQRGYLIPIYTRTMDQQILGLIDCHEAIIGVE